MEALLHNLIKATGWSILHSLWQGAIIYGLVMLVQLGFPQLKAKTRYLFAFSANSLMLLCFVFTFLKIFDLPVSEAHGTTASGLAATNNFLATQVSVSQYAEKLFPYLVCLYVIGIGIQSFFVFQGYQKILSLKKGPHTQIPENWKLLFDTLTQKLNIRRKVTFWLSDQVQVPLIIGYMKPVVLFPISLATQMDLAQVEAILIHELSHIRRNDYLLNLFRTMIDTLLFFNPFVWLIGKYIDIEREHACDDMVVGLTQTPMTYAHALLKLELLADHQNLDLALAATGKKQYLYQRIKRITDMKTDYMNAKQKFFAITLTLVTVISLAWIKPLKAEISLHEKSAALQSAIQLSLKENINKIMNPALSLQQEPADTSKKKLKINIKTKDCKDSVGRPDIDTVIQNNGGVIDLSDVMITVNNSLTGLTDSIINNINFEGLTNEEFKAVSSMGKNKFSADDASVFRIKDPLSPQEKKRIEALQKELDELGKKMGKAVSPLQKMKKANMKMKAELRRAPVFTAKQQADIQEISSALAAKTMEIHKIVSSAEGQKNTLVLTKNYKITGLNRADQLRDQEIKQSREYQELKKKFDDDVKVLMEKKSQREKAIQE
ncbi:M56 family metallopeptidase [Pedobacter sp. AW31-3R]|uniref:M56 family metallopeptidase n=1 Tax=Pedobacter sp. AW31-3R TaxID=3445781 RepID=UPI003F9F1FD5